MGSFQASMLEAFHSLRDELSNKKKAEVVQTSASASRPGTSAVNLDLPLRDLITPQPRIWMWTMVQHFLQVSHLITRISWIRFQMHPRNLLRRSRIHLNHTLIGSMMIRNLSRTNTLMNPTNLGFHLPNLRNMLTRYKSRSRYVSSSSEEDQPSGA